MGGRRQLGTAVYYTGKNITNLEVLEELEGLACFQLGVLNNYCQLS